MKEFSSVSEMCLSNKNTFRVPSILETRHQRNNSNSPRDSHVHQRTSTHTSIKYIQI